jgi:hypothetical protein
MRGRNHDRSNQNSMSRAYESNGPDVKIRGNPVHIAEKYIQLARDAQASGDPVSAENYYQHAEHYYRLIAAAQEQFRQNNPHLARPDNEIIGARDDLLDDDEDGGPMGVGDQHQQRNAPRSTPTIQPNGNEANEVDRLPSITGALQGPHLNPGPNGHDSQPDRFPIHRGRRRYRGPRQDFQGGERAAVGPGNDTDDPSRRD